MSILQKVLKKKFVRFFGIGMGGVLVLLALKLLSSVLTARVLGPEDKGFMTLLYSTILMSNALLSIKLGMSQAYFRKYFSFEVLVGSSLFIAVFSGLITALFAYLAVSYLFVDMYEGLSQRNLAFMIAAIPCLLIANNMMSVLVADYAIPSATFVEITRPLILLIGFAAAVLVGNGTLDAVVACVFASISGMALISFILVIKRGLSELRPRLAAMKQMISFSLKVHIGEVLRYMQFRLDIFVVAYFLDAEKVGIYGIAMTLAEILWKVPNVIGKILLPRIAQEDEKNSAIITARLNRLVFTFTLFCSLFLALIIDYLVLFLFGEDYAQASLVVKTLLPGVLAVSVFRLLTPNLIMQKRASTYSLCVFCSVSVMLVLDLILIPRYGLVGAGLACSAAYITLSGLILMVVVRTNDLPLREYFDVSIDIRELVSKYHSK